MTYCVGVSLDAGLVLTSDSRTNAGIDNVSTYSKMYQCETTPDRFLVILSAGNLATTQAVIQQVKRDVHEGKPRNINNMGYLADVADYLGEILVNLIRKHNEQGGFIADATLVLGGQIQGREPNLYMIYPQGNYITSSNETPYLQIGESKYGKPVLDRFLTNETSLEDAAICSLISMDSTMKSNASVGPPIEVLIYKRDQFTTPKHYKFDAEDPYLLAIRQEWAHHLNQAFRSMPRLETSQVQPNGYLRAL
ncbi:proteasome-type protease [Thiothrix lacustris]|jgi:putative proteasome-type protease|uniref:Proteasome-type protease n=1 Tax=Thiothrix lacustris TaxID=525917 RepID=A0ABY9MNJ5_9GAMM|nr:proteasome-type protease [Thiothrix lacustris]WML90224.1 proteasome-type protease [Thiothrix lacustris]WMP16825.1 proteasome-type protease [Thiothrix lacustris]